MAIKPRVFTGSVDLGDIKAVTEAVLDEAVELYDLTYRTVLETFAEPLSAGEIRQMLAALDFQSFGAVVQGDPESARGMLREAKGN